MEISDELRSYLENHKKELMTTDEETCYHFWVDSIGDIRELNLKDVNDLLVLFISSGVHIEKYFNDIDFNGWMFDITFFKPVELHFDNVNIIYSPSLYDLNNVTSIYLPKCTKIDVPYSKNIIVNNPQLEYVYLPKCRKIDVKDIFRRCANLKKVDCPKCDLSKYGF